MSDTRKSEKTTASLDTDVSALMEEFTKGGKRSASRSKSSAPIDKKLSVEEFTELDISPDFKPIRSDVTGQEDQVGKAVAAFGGEEEAEIEKAAPMTQPAAAVASPAAAPVAPITDVAPANEDRPARSKLPIAAAAIASLALVSVLGAQSWKSASAVEVVGYAAAPPATPSHSQLNMATSAAEIIPQPTSTQLAMAEPSQSRGTAIPVQPSATNVGLQAPAPASRKPQSSHLCRQKRNPAWHKRQACRAVIARRATKRSRGVGLLTSSRAAQPSWNPVSRSFISLLMFMPTVRTLILSWLAILTQ